MTATAKTYDGWTVILPKGWTIDTVSETDNIYRLLYEGIEKYCGTAKNCIIQAGARKAGAK